MSKKNSATINIIAILSLIIFGYILFFTVYRQMISQNEGFFYVIVFGGILVLVYILLSLMTKLLAFSTESEGKAVFAILETIFIIVMSILYIKSRIEYSTSVPADESIIYHTAELIDLGDLSIGGMDIFPQLLNNPQTFIMGHFLSFIFKFTGVDPAVIVYVNTGLLLLTSLIVFIITRLLSSRICSLLAFVTCLFMPTFGFSVYSYDSQLFYAFIMSIALLFMVLLITKAGTNGLSVLYIILSGLFFGISFAMEPAGILILLFIMLFNKDKLLLKKSLFVLLTALIIFFGLSYLKSLSLDLSFAEIMTGFITSSNPFISEYGDRLEFSEIFSSFNDKLDSQQKAINDNYYFLSTSDGSTFSSVNVAWLQLGNQVLYMFMLILSISCSFYMLRSKKSRAVPILSCITASFLMIFLCSGNEYNILFFIIFIIISGALSLQYMYENHHALADESFQELIAAEEESEEKEPEEEIDSETFMLRSQALIFVGANESYYQQIKKEEKEQKENKEEKSEEPKEPIMAMPVEEDTKLIEDEVELLEVPIPMPPKHIKKELDYDNDLTESENDDFDFDYDSDTDDDDFDDYDDYDEE